MRRFVVVAAVLIGTLALPLPAHACVGCPEGQSESRPTASGEQTEDGGSVGASSPGEDNNSDGRSGRRGTGGVTCFYFDAPFITSGGIPQIPGVGLQVSSFVEGQLYWRNCYNLAGQELSFRLFTYEPGVPVVSGAELAVMARAEVILEFPEPQANPPVDAEQLVGVKTWLWVDQAGWQPASATATVPGLSATVTATPVATEWKMGDGKTVHCEGPGTPYTDGARTTDCGHLYSVASTGRTGGVYDAAVTVVWSVRWSATDGTGGDLGTLRRTTPFQLQVGERQASIR